MTEGQWVEFLSRPELPAFQERIAFSVDLTARLVFADWIDEHHPDPEFAQALRSSITPDFNGESIPCPGFPGERLGAQLENGQFVISGGDDILAGPADPRSCLRTLWESGWLQTAELNRVTPDKFRDWCRLPTPRLLTSLKVYSGLLGDDELQALAQSTHVSRLAVLHLNGSGIGTAGLSHLLAPGGMSPWIEVLSIVSTSIDDDAVSGIVEADCTQRLTMLQLAMNRLGESCGRNLTAAERLKRLKYLDLSYNELGDAGVGPLASGDWLRWWETVKLGHTAVGDDGVVELCEGMPRSWAGHTVLGLDGNRIGNAGADRIARLKRMVRDLGDQIERTPSDWLTTLDLRYNAIGDAGAISLADAPGISNLLLDGNPIGAEGARRLAASPHLKAEIAARWTAWRPEPEDG